MQRDKKASKQCLYKRLVGAVLIAAAMVLSGCSPETSGTGVSTSQKQGSILVLVLVDSTDSAAARKEEWHQAFQKLLTNYLPDDAKITLIRCDHHPEVGASKRLRGTKAQREAILKELEQVWKPRPCGRDIQGKETYCGSDVVGALELAIQYATKPENQGYRRKMIIGWTDLVADPCKRDPKNPVRYREPTDYQPSDAAKALELILHGVPVQKHQALHQKWDPAFKRVHLYGPGEEIEVERQYELQAIEGWL